MRFLEGQVENMFVDVQRLDSKNCEAFSLIELMVVVAVVGVLSVIAVPSYKNYVERAKLSVAANTVVSHDAPVMTFYNTKGVFPNSVIDLGIPGGTDPDNFINPPYVVSFEGGGALAGPTQCKNASYYSYITNYDGGNFFNGSGNLILYYITFVEVNGTVRKYCSYLEFDSNLNETGATDLLPNCLQLKSGIGLPDEILDIVDNACN